MIRILDLNIKNILSDWKISDALRELIANAIDEQVLSQTEEIEVSYSNDDQTVIIKDFGSGIKPSDFVQNENKEKQKHSNLIGKFGIGLKDALAVLVRHEIQVDIISNYGHFKPILKQKVGLEENLKSIHIEHNDEEVIKVGTTFKINPVTKEEYDNALNLFLKFQNLNPVATTNKGEVYLTNKHEKASIYFNGLKISSDDGFIYSYNITNPNATLRKSLNRERKNVSRDSYRDCILSILLNIGSKNEKYEVYTHILKEAKNRTENTEWNFIDVKKVIIKFLNEEKSNYLIISEEQAKSDEGARLIQYANENQKEIIILSNKEYSSIAKENSECTIDNWWKEAINDYEIKIINVNDLSNIERKNWKIAMKFKDDLINKLKSSHSQLMQFPVKNYSFQIVEEHPEYSGLTEYSHHTIKIVRRELFYLKNLLSTLIHELVHALTHTSDATIEFERMLSDMTAELATWLIKSKNTFLKIH